MRVLGSITNRIFLASALLAMLSIGAAVFFVSARMTRETEAELQRDLTEAATLVDEQRRTQFDNIARTARLIADLPKCKAGVDTGDPPTMEPIAIDYQQQAGADLLIVTGRRGETLALVGRSGSGKTTALKAMLGLIPFEGELSVLGRDPRTQRDDLMQDVCFIADVAVLPRWMRVKEAIEFVAGVHPRFDRARCERFLAGTQLKPQMRVRELSKGMIVQLHLALVMAIDARIEPQLDDFEHYLKNMVTSLVGLYGPYDGVYGLGAPIPYYAMSAQRYKELLLEEDD
jgi:hypothetical protein